MSPIRLIILGVAAAAAIAAAFLVRNMASTPPAPVEAAPIVEAPKVRMVKVLTARRDMSRGELLTEADMVWTEWPEDALNPLFYNDRDMPEALTDLAGAAVRNEIFENEPLMGQKLVEKGETGYMAALVKPGMRAVSIEVSPETASGGFILPDDRVDVIVTYELEVTSANGQRDEVSISQTILENVRVLAIDQIFRQNEAGAYTPGSVATLELDLESSEVLMLASRTGEISLALRSFADAAASGPDAISTSESYLAMVSPLSPEANTGRVSIIRSGRTEEVRVGGGAN